MALNSKGTCSRRVRCQQDRCRRSEDVGNSRVHVAGCRTRPRRVTITSDDIIWYSDFSRGYLGRLDPATGKVTEWQSPSGPKTEPYGISAINDIIWYSESGSTPNTIVRFDPKTAKFQSWAIPGGGNIVRNTSVTPDGNFVLANSLVNNVTLVTIKK